MVAIITAALVTAGAFTDFSMPNIDGKGTSFKAYKGKVVMVVNVASKCGLTPQYEGLEALYKKYKDQGFVILGFPANDFGSQEPGSNAEIKQFCTGKYNVSFPMFSKITVVGKEKSPLYSWLIEKSGRADEIEWNFAKFIVHKDGTTVERFTPKTTPDNKDLVRAIEKALNE
jgi:glutathione peroxidase